MLGSGVVSQQFSIPEMVDLANFSAEFFRHAGEHLRILGFLFKIIFFKFNFKFFLKITTLQIYIFFQLE